MGDKGFTLTELMVALVILGLIMSVVYKVFSTQERFFRTQEQVSAMQENLRATMEFINQELSWLGYRVPGIGVLKASPTDIIFQANIPNTGQTIQYIRYQFNPTLNNISRATGAYVTGVEDNNLRVMASDIEAMAFSYFNVQNELVNVNPASPPCASTLSTTLCSPGIPGGVGGYPTGGDKSLLMIQRVKARVTARTSQPDWQYTDPESGANPNFRKRKAVLDLKARNLEDVTTQAGQIVLGYCGELDRTVTPPTIPGNGKYAACRDQLAMLSGNVPDMTSNWDDNPLIEVFAKNADLTTNTNPNRGIQVYAYDDNNTSYNIYDPTDTTAINNHTDTGELRYLAAQGLSNVTPGTYIHLKFVYTDGVCTQVVSTMSNAIQITGGAASHFDNSGDYFNSGLSVSYVDSSGGAIALSAPGKVRMCQAVSGERVLLGAKLLDGCNGSIPGETVNWSHGGAGGSFVDETDNGDGTYSATWIPPDTMPTAAPDYSVNLNALWGSFSPAIAVTLIAAMPHDIVIDSIVDISKAGIFQFSSSVLDRASQLGGNTGSSFEIERIDGQEVGIRFHLEDACGNRVFGETVDTVSVSIGHITGPTYNPSTGSYDLAWESNLGCGIEQLDQNIFISVSTIADPATKSETVAFKLLTTRSQNPDAGPFLVLDSNPLGKQLQAGNTNDNVTIQAEVLEYQEDSGFCVNLHSSTFPRVFPVKFTVAGEPTGNGSFDAVSPFNTVSKSVDSDNFAVAAVQLYSGTADWDGSLMVTATATINGADYSGIMNVGMKETNHPQVKSGIYRSGLYGLSDKIGTGESFNPGDDLYLQIFDYDENEEPTGQDSFSSPYDVEVTLESALTGDIEVVGLTEWSGNSAEFRATLNTRFFPALATTVDRDDKTLQVRDGDTITMTYKDKDNPLDNPSWTVKTLGADTFRIFRLPAPEVEVIDPADPLQVAVSPGDSLRPELSLPFLAGDGSSDADTVTITIVSGSGADDTDILVLREEGDTGIMVPDWLIYSGKYFSMLRTDPSDFAYLLATPTLPRYVTMTYDVPGSYLPAKTRTFFMKDQDPPLVAITTPSAGAVLSSEVQVMVNAVDVANATSWAGIDHVELYINGRLYQTLPGAGLPGDHTFTWTTAVGSIPYWLDGGHTLSAVAYDKSLNMGASAAVGVSVSNGLTPIWFPYPTNNAIYSQSVDIGMQVANMAPAAGTYTVSLAVGGAIAASFAGTGGGTYVYNLDTIPASGSTLEGEIELIATLQDAQGNDFWTVLQIFGDHVPPAITYGPPPSYLTTVDVITSPLSVDIDIQDPIIAAGDPNRVDTTTVLAHFAGPGACDATGLTPTISPALGNGTYTFEWPGSIKLCDDVEGIMTLTVDAADVAMPSPNQASTAISTRIDTAEPVVKNLAVGPMVGPSFTVYMTEYNGGQEVTVGGFITGDVIVSAAASDMWPLQGSFEWEQYLDQWSLGNQYSLPLDASSGTFSVAWATSDLAAPIPPPHDEGFYRITADAWDEAGNQAVTRPYLWVYLDNNLPGASLPSVIPNALPTQGYINVIMEALDQGFLSTVEHRYIESGMGIDPDIGPWEHVESYSFTAQEKVRDFRKIYSMDTCTLTPGSTYEIWAYATDHAGHVALRQGPVTITVENLIYVSPPNTLDPDGADLSWKEAPPPGSGDWQLTLDTATINDCNGPAAFYSVKVSFHRWYWTCMDPPTCSLYDYDLDGTIKPADVYSVTVTTDAAGHVGTISAPSGTWTYNSTDMAAILFEPVAGPYWNNYWIPLFLDHPQPPPPDPSSPPAWWELFGSDTQYLMATGLTYDLAPAFAPSYLNLTVSGNLIWNSGKPAEGYSVQMELNYWSDSLPGWITTIRYSGTDSAGYFKFTPPDDLRNDYSVKFRLYGIQPLTADFLREVSWDCVKDKWLEWLE
ncbi:MAG: prepilin-type N-terminal cleavage/methylation domain-containing protein [bacterium]|nr:prepilin-type N-terminal cleavage/methylation domain-containing protein [bacterium]